MQGLFHNFGDICHLKEIIRLKEDYKYRLILDDSHAFGTIHKYGTPGYFDISFNKIDMYLSSMDCSLGSTGTQVVFVLVIKK